MRRASNVLANKDVLAMMRNKMDPLNETGDELYARYMRSLEEKKRVVKENKKNNNNNSLIGKKGWPLKKNK